MSPAGGIERVVSRHVLFFSECASVWLLTKSKNDSFYPIPNNVKCFGLDCNEELNMNFIGYRIVQMLKQIVAVRRPFRKQMERIKPNIVYCSSPINLLELFIYGVKLNKILVTEHGSFFAYNVVYRIIKRLLYPKCLLVVAPTRLDYCIYSRWSTNARYIPNPLPFKQSVKSSLNYKIVLNIGRLTDEKQHILLLKIWKEVCRTVDDWKLRIVGSGENENMLKNKIKSLGLENSVELIPPKKDIINEYLGSAIFVLTSRTEGFGMVLAEAMECGLPCISFNCPSGPRDIITNNHDGFLIEKNNLKKYYECLVKLIMDEDLRRVMGTRATISICRFNESIVRNMWKNIFSEL
jgi:glycosyltransferase involved in cell wall biosynthesis